VLKAQLPDYMLPSIVVAVDQFHYTPSGKLDRKAFPAPTFDRSSISSEFVPPRTSQEKSIAAIWQAVLQVEPVGIDDNFFELGGNSLRAAAFLRQLKADCQLDLTSPLFFNAPTIRGVLEHAKAATGTDVPTGNVETSIRIREPATKSHHGFAIVGMAARLPGAANLQQFWQNLVDGVESIRFFKPEELDPSLDPKLTSDARYVAARGILDHADMFDAGFFAEPPTSAALIDPQQRVMLEVAYEALEDAAIRCDRAGLRIGVWAGTYNTTYHTKNVLSNLDIVAEHGEFQLGVYNEKDYIATRIAYKLNLNGPAINVNTACSTSLVAIIEACNSLAAGQCDAAIAGACSIYFPQHSGHIHQPGSIFSPDGHCRPFDADGAGTLFSDGAGAVVLKRLDDALRDGDRIYATVCGLGINNDGTRKASFSAPTISGEAGAVAMALQDAGFSARSIGYIEAHGTATPVGDPIEIAALQTDRSTVLRYRIGQEQHRTCGRRRWDSWLDQDSFGIAPRAHP
jgi:3-oxoacyl-(acyl-carrier-protein) synthase